MNINNDLFRQKSRTTKMIQATIDLADKNKIDAVIVIDPSDRRFIIKQILSLLEKDDVLVSNNLISFNSGKSSIKIVSIKDINIDVEYTVLDENLSYNNTFFDHRAIECKYYNVLNKWLKFFD